MVVDLGPRTSRTPSPWKLKQYEKQLRELQGAYCETVVCADRIEPELSIERAAQLVQDHQIHMGQPVGHLH